MFSLAVVVLAGCVCIASAENPISYSTTSVSYGKPAMFDSFSPYSYAPFAYSSLPASTELFKYNAGMPQMSVSMPWVAKMDESSKMQIMPMMAYGASYIPESYSATALKQTHPISTPMKTTAYATELKEPITYTMPLKTIAPEFKTTAWSTELKQTHPITSQSFVMNAVPYSAFPIKKEFVMPIETVMNKEMPIAVAKTTVLKKESPVVYSPEFEGFKTKKFMMPFEYDAMIPLKENLAMPLATSKSMFTMKHKLDTPAATTLLSPSLEGFETIKYPFTI